MRARTIVLPDEDHAAFAARLDSWIVALDPRDDVERHLVVRAVEVSWKQDRLRRILEVRREAARQADADRLAARAEQVVALGRHLFWYPAGPLCLYPRAAPSPGGGPCISWSGDPDDPHDPARIVMRPEAMALGCAWLLERWGELRQLLDSGLVWQPHDRLKAVRMLGRQPLEAIDDPRVMAIYTGCFTIDPSGGHELTDLMSEFAPGSAERATCMDRLTAREAVPPLEPEEARGTLLALIAEEEERLDGILARHLEREEAEAAAALEFDASAEGERLRRYEAENDRALLRIIEALHKRHREADASVASGGRAAVQVADPLARAAGATLEAASPEPAPEPARTEPGRPDEPDAGPAGLTAVATMDVDILPSIERDVRNPTGVADRTVALARLLASAVLALFALLVFAGFSAASNRVRDARTGSAAGCSARGIGKSGGDRVFPTVLPGDKEPELPREGESSCEPACAKGSNRVRPCAAP